MTNKKDKPKEEQVEIKSPVKETKEEVVQETSSTKVEVDMSALLRLKEEIKREILEEQAELNKVIPTTKSLAEKEVEFKFPKSAISKLADLTLPKKVSIDHYIDKSVENMGLTAMGISVLDGEGGRGGFSNPHGYLIKSGVKFHLTGFEYPSFNIESIKDVNEKEKLMSSLSDVRKVLEDIFHEDLSCKNTKFWKEIRLKVRGKKNLNMKEPKDILIYYGIKGGAYHSVAPSFEHAEGSNNIYKFYLHEDIVEEAVKISYKRRRNTAIAKLEELYSNGDSALMFYITKNALPITKGYTLKDPIDRLYNDLNDFILGVNVKSEKAETAEKFLAAANLPSEEMYRKALVKEAIYFKQIRKNDEKSYYNLTTYTIYGKRIADINGFLDNPSNGDELEAIRKGVETVWNKS